MQRSQDIVDAVYGSVIGGAIGDALGAPVEGWYYAEIRERYGRVTEFLDTGRDNAPNGPGGVTDDSVLAHYIALAIIRKGRRITPDDLAQVWLELGENNHFWLNERLTLLKLRAGMSPWDSGLGNIPAGCATMAAGVAAAFIPGIEVEGVIEQMLAHSTYVVRRAIELTLDLAYDSHDVDAFAAKFYERMLDWTWPSRRWNKDRFFSGSSIEIVPVTMALLHLCQGDVNECLIEGASFGRDCDTIARAVGCVAGASAIRVEWIETVERANRPVFEQLEGDPEAGFASLAQRLAGVLWMERRAAQDRADMLGAILGEGRTHPAA